MNWESLTSMPPSVEQSVKPGYRLRLAREARHLSQERVAAQLHLSLQQIAAIEEDDYSYAPAVVYAKGHLTLYARLLGVPPEEILQGFARLEPETLVTVPPMPPQEPSLMTAKEQAVRFWQNAKIRWWSLGIAAFLLLLITIGWAGRADEVNRKTADRLVVAPGDAGEISQVNENTITVPTKLAPANPLTAKTPVTDSKNETNKNKTNKTAHDSFETSSQAG